jgi:uncharacterized protein (TIGR02996 family)
MTDREALTRACLDNPADNTPRLVLADYLDGDDGSPPARARASLIRLGCELARLPAVVGRTPAGGARVNPDHARLTAEVEKLLKRWGRRLLPRCLRDGVREFTQFAWCTACFDWDNTPARFATFGRGFVEAVGVGIEPDGPASFYGEQCGLLLREVAAHNPLETARLTVPGCTPAVEYTLDRAAAHWALHADEVGGRPGEARGTTAVYDTRRDLLRALPRFVADTLARVAFVRRDFDPEEVAGPADVEPWDQDIGGEHAH